MASQRLAKITQLGKMAAQIFKIMRSLITNLVCSSLEKNRARFIGFNSRSAERCRLLIIFQSIELLYSDCWFDSCYSKLLVISLAERYTMQIRCFCLSCILFFFWWSVELPLPFQERDAQLYKKKLEPEKRVSNRSTLEERSPTSTEADQKDQKNQ